MKKNRSYDSQSCDTDYGFILPKKRITKGIWQDLFIMIISVVVLYYGRNQTMQEVRMERNHNRQNILFNSSKKLYWLQEIFSLSYMVFYMTQQE